MTTTRKPTRRRGLVSDAAPNIAWMSRGVCLERGDLPWIADPEQTTAPDRLAMTAICQDCPVRPDCAGYTSSQKVTAGFWAGRNRDPATSRVLAGSGWTIDPLPGLGGLGGAA